MKSEHGGFLLKIIQPIDLVKRQLTRLGERLLYMGASTLGHKASILQMCL